MIRTPFESNVTPTSHDSTGTAQLNVVCRSKPKLPNQIDPNSPLLVRLTHQLGSARDWSDVRIGPLLQVSYS